MNIKKSILLPFLVFITLISISFVNSENSINLSENNAKILNYDSLPDKYHDWDCIFNENFDGDSLDLNKWQIRHDKGRWEEWFSKENIKVADGNLIITGKEENSPFGNKKYSAGEISTGKSFNVFSGNIKYGYFEARIKVPRGFGFFPAFWLSVKNGDSKNKSWPPELDIVEYTGFRNKIAEGTIWYKDSTGKPVSKLIYKKHPLFFANDFHIYSVEWNQNEIIFYLDNIEVGRTSENVPQDFLRIVLSLQLNNIPKKGMNFTRLNKKMYVDYVRVYVPKNYKNVKGYEKCGVFLLNSDIDIELEEYND